LEAELDFLSNGTFGSFFGRHQNEASSLAKLIGKRLRIGEGFQLFIFLFGKCDPYVRIARKGRTPQTGEAIKIAAKKVPVFKAGKGLKEAVK
jgi:nucleoid DNA-binding protein